MNSTLETIIQLVKVAIMILIGLWAVVKVGQIISLLKIIAIELNAI